MINEQQYYHLYSNTNSPFSIPTKEYEIVRKTWLCTGCSHPKPIYKDKGIDVIIENERLNKNSPLNFIHGCSLPAAHEEFLMTFGKKKIMDNFYLGKIFRPDGTIINGWFTFHSNRKIIIRGTKQAGYRKCEECGRNLYYAAGKRYIYPSPPLDVPLFESDLCGLLVSEHLFESLSMGKWKKMFIEKLAVLSKPKDGFITLKSVFD